MRRTLFAALLVTSGCVIVDDDTDRANSTGSGLQCGGWNPWMCEADEYCDYPADTCGIADESGVCRARPTACDDIYMPVEGCDGETYGNACEAHGAGKDVMVPFD